MFNYSSLKVIIIEKINHSNFFSGSLNNNNAKIFNIAIEKKKLKI